MSDLLKKIIKSQAINEGRFYTKEDGKVYEKVVTAEDSFTGYYQDSGGTLYTKEGWEEEKKRQFKEFEAQKKEELRIAQEKRAAEVRAKKERLVKTVVNRGSKNKNYYKLYVGLLAIVVMLSVLIYGLWERHYKKEVVAAPVKEIIKEKEEVILFGNAIVTGDEVNLRQGPSTNTPIIRTLGKRGERVELLRTDSVVSRWEKIRLENGTQGWIYDLYISKLK